MHHPNPDRLIWGYKHNDGTGVTTLQGGYANVVASAADLSEFELKMKLALDELGLDLIEIDDAEALPLTLSKAQRKRRSLDDGAR